MKKDILKKLVVTTLMISVVFTLPGCTKKPMERIEKNGTIIIGTSADYPPYEFHKNVNGADKVVGFDIMIAEEVAKDLGAKIQIKDMKFDGLLGALKSNKIDMVIAGMNPTADRAKQVDFSKTYYTAVQAVIVRDKDKDKLKSFEDLKGKVVGVQMATTQEEIAKEQMKGAEIKSLGKITDLVLELKNKKIDALVVELPVAQAYADKNKDIVISDMKFGEGSSQKSAAIAIKKGNKDFVDAVNKTLDRLIKEDKISKFIIDANNLVE